MQPSPPAGTPELPLPPPTFDSIPLSADIRQAVDELGYTHPTPVQRAVFEPAIRGKSLVVQARTGTGKTAAFGLPIVDQLVRKGTPKVQALILTPTRELALQVAREIEKLGKVRGLHVLPIYGGAPMGAQVDALARGAQIVCGTPGRVLDHLRKKTLDPSHIKVFVLDEADEMLSMGFAKELHAIVEMLPKERQGLFFSATIPPDIERLARSQLRDPEFVTLSSDQVGALEVTHLVYVLQGGDKRVELVRILEAEDPESAIVFCNTKDETQRVAEALQNKGYDADWLNGDLEQKDRERIMARTREGKLRFLVATDVAARGIDLSHVTHVINADFPETAEGYVHRTGRTGRAGRTGTAISIVGPKDIGNLYILRLTYKIRPIERQLPSAGELKTRMEHDLVGVFAEAFAGRAVHPDDLALARRMLTHVDAEKIVAGLLRDHLGARQSAGEDPVTAAAEARRAKNPPPVHTLNTVPPAAPPAPIAPRADRPREPRELREAREPRPERPAPGMRGREARANERMDDSRKRNDVPRVAAAPPLEPAGETPPTERAAVPAVPGGRRPRGRVPHSSFATWEPPIDADDDQPIFTGERPPLPSYQVSDAPRPAPAAFAPPSPAASRDEGDGDIEDPAIFSQIFVNVGRRDGAKTGDFQKLLMEGAGLAKEDTGRIRVRERNTFITVKKESLERAVTAIAGQVIGGRTVIAEPAKPRAVEAGASRQG